jgi:hypothetical protein
VWRNTPELSGDSTARRELHTRRIEIERKLDVIIDDALRGAGFRKGRWFHDGRPVSIRDGRHLNKKLSDICDRVFRDTPQIDNEIINREELSSAAAAARRTLVEHMIDHAGEPELGLTGNPPERSIYRSLLSTEGGLGLHRSVADGWAFRPPLRSSSAAALFRAIDQFFADSEQSPRPLGELFTRLRQPPFGLRTGPLPVLVCAALLAKEADVALYEDGTFCTSLTPAIFERLVKAPDRFASRRLRVTGVRGRVFQELENVVGAAPSPNADKQQVLRVARPLLRFITLLPDFARQTAQVSPTAEAIRNALVTATEPETLLFADLPKACGLKPFRSHDRGRDRDVKQYVRSLRDSLAELRDAYPKLLSSIRHALMDAFGMDARSEKAVETVRDRSARLSPYTVERDLRMFLDRACEGNHDEERWVEGIASLVAERPVQKWRDEDSARFLVRLRQFVRRFMLLEATVTDRPKDLTAEGAESIRIALTGTRFGQVDHAVHLDSRLAARVQNVELRIEQAIDANGDPATIAALCRVLQRRLLARRAGLDGVAQEASW